jgi:hypothetical protein
MSQRPSVLFGASGPVSFSTTTAGVDAAAAVVAWFAIATAPVLRVFTGGESAAAVARAPPPVAGITAAAHKAATASPAAAAGQALLL